MSHRWRLTLFAIIGVVCLASIARAESTVIISGTIQMSWDGSLSGIDLQGSATHLIADDMQSPPQGFQAGQVVDLGSTVGTVTMTHPVSVTVNGISYASVWVQGQFSITAAPFTVPSEPDGASTFFSTPIAMTGQFSGYSDQSMTAQVFALSMSGGGVASIGPLNVVATDTFLLRSGGLIYRFTSPVPSPWTSADIGSAGQSGIASYDGGTFYVSGSGADIWNTADSFQFVSQPLDDDGAIVARVLSVSDTNTFAKAGVMIRSSLGAGAADVILDLRPTTDIEFMTRGSNDTSTSYLGGARQGAPVWLRLTRSGAIVAAAVSTDGTTWNAVGSTTFPAGPVLVGLAVTSHDDNALNTSAFDNVAVNVAAPSPPSDIVVYAGDISASAVHGQRWSFALDPTAAAGVKLTTADNGVSNTSSPLASPDDYVDVTFAAAPNTAYTVWLRLIAAQNSKWNDSVWVQFSDATVGGTPVYPVDSTSGLLVNLATDSSAASLDGWGWQNGAYWLSQPATVTFDDNPTHTLRIQLREDGVSFDQIVLSPVTYATSAPGPVGGDHTIVPKPPVP